MNQEELKAALKKWLYQEMQQHSLGAQSRPLNPDDFRPYVDLHWLSLLNFDIQTELIDFSAYNHKIQQSSMKRFLKTRGKKENSSSLIRRLYASM